MFPPKGNLYEVLRGLKHARRDRIRHILPCVGKSVIQSINEAQVLDYSRLDTKFFLSMISSRAN